MNILVASFRALPAMNFVNFILDFIRSLENFRLKRKDVVDQLYFVSVQSAPIILFCITFAALVTILEASFHMKLVIQNDALVPGFASVLILRELGSVVTCLLVTSRVGAGYAAEISSMKVTEQLEALRMLGINPLQYLLVPRLIASILGCWMLSVLASLTCLYSAMVFSDIKLGYPPGIFLMALRTFVSLSDLGITSVKGLIFGTVIPIFACYHGISAKPGAEGVGQATTQAVVSISVAIIMLDFFVTWCFS